MRFYTGLHNTETRYNLKRFENKLQKLKINLDTAQMLEYIESAMNILSANSFEKAEPVGIVLFIAYSESSAFL